MIPGIIASAGNGGGVPTVTWNPADLGPNIVLSGGNLTATKTTNDALSSLRATLARSAGKYYFEVLISGGGTSPFRLIGVANAAMSLNGSLNNANGWAYYQEDGSKRHNGINTAYGDIYGVGDVIGVALDLDAGLIWWAKDNIWQGGGDPAAGTGEAFSGLSSETLFPAATLFRGNPTAHSVVGRFGPADFDFSPPSGFNPWGS